MVENNVPLTSRKLLIISFHFPPTGSIAAVRIDKFARYLPGYGWNTLVLTVDSIRGYPATLQQGISESLVTRTAYSGIGMSLMNTLSGKAGMNNTANKVSTTAALAQRIKGLLSPLYTLPLLRLLLMEPLGWYRPAVRAGMEIIKNQGVDAIFSSYGPAMSHFTAARLHRLTGIPWIAEYRDLWTLNHYYPRVQPFHFLEQCIERHVLKGSAKLVTVSKPLSEKLSQLHGRPVTTIHNGFDQDDYGDIPLTERFTITYTGKILPGKQDPRPLFVAVADLVNSKMISPDNFELRFFGDITLSTLISPLVKNYHLEEIVKDCGFVPNNESLQRQRESTVLLLLTWTDTREKGIYTGKVFEYLGAGRPVLAVGPKDGVVDRLLTECGAGVTFSQSGDIRDLLARWIDEFRADGRISSHFSPRGEVIRQYTRKAKAGELAKLLDSAVKTDTDI